jgi:branched-chain amino acid transport system ATP-binding protein
MTKSPVQTRLLELQGVGVNYGGIQALKQIDLSIDAGECVTLIGANGAGKTTTLRAISRLLPLTTGQIIYSGRNIVRVSPHKLVGQGLAHSPEGRRVLARQTVRDNLLLGAYSRSNSRHIPADLRQQFDQLAGTLSGGEQQMLAIARALMSRPQLLLLDEPSLGLAPTIVQEIFAIIRTLLEEKVTILLVEQNANLALQIANRGYVLEAGQIILSGLAADLRQNPRVKQAYLG